MKNLKYIFLSILSISMIACENDLVEDIRERNNNSEIETTPELMVNDVDFSNYVAIGASFTAGFSDGGLFRASQERSFPQLLSEQFAFGGGGTFSQPLMDDNTGGILVGGNVAAGYRLVFGGAGPVPLDAFLASQGAPVPPITTEAGNNIGSNFNNFGIPGAKSFHFITPGYAAFNPFYTRIASGATSTVLGDALAQNPTFFTLSEVGGNDVLGYATSGGTGVDQTGNIDPSTYGGNDITDPNVFAQAFSQMVGALTQNGAKGVVTTVPDITSLSHFTTVPHNPLDPTNPSFGPQIPTLNGIFSQLNQVFAFLSVPERSIVFSETSASAVVIRDDSLTDLSAQITQVLLASPTFPAFVQSFGLPAAAAPQVAGLLGLVYGQARQATANDLLVLPSASVIGTVNEDFAAFLGSQGLPPTLAGQFSVEGVSLPLEDKWVLSPQEQNNIAMATAAYNATIFSVADSNPNVAVADLRAVLEQASTSGYPYDDYVMTTDLVFGGLVSLDGVHLTSRGYGLMAREFLVAIDTTFGTNFIASGTTPVAADLPTNYSPTLQ
ncbi:G-D-S-L family lipolytic protein [Psychroserpens sp. XS_ASV72]|uniref:G-D-S-L family lipolytic protein n=1 Tax=Psychroserpens sp. XS_ASV72 TaxID=3241293 RepID=UPI0035137449